MLTVTLSRNPAGKNSSSVTRRSGSCQVGQWAEFPATCLSSVSSCSLHVEDSSSCLVSFYDKVVAPEPVLACLAFIE